MKICHARNQQLYRFYPSVTGELEAIVEKNMVDSGLEPGTSNKQKFKEEGFDNVGDSVHQKVCQSLQGIQDTKNNMITLTEREQTRKELRLRSVG